MFSLRIGLILFLALAFGDNVVYYILGKTKVAKTVCYKEKCAVLEGDWLVYIKNISNNPNDLKMYGGINLSYLPKSLSGIISTNSQHEIIYILFSQKERAVVSLRMSKKTTMVITDVRKELCQYEAFPTEGKYIRGFIIELATKKYLSIFLLNMEGNIDSIPNTLQKTLCKVFQ